MFEKPIQNEKQWLEQIYRRVQVLVLFEVRGKFFGDQWMNLRAARQTPPVESLLSQPLYNGNFGKGRKFCTGTDAPALQSFHKLERNTEGFERKPSDPKTFLSGRNDRDTGETLRRTDGG